MLLVMRQLGLALKIGMLNCACPLKTVQQAAKEVECIAGMQRFQSLQQCLSKVVLPPYIAATIANAARDMDHIVQKVLTNEHTDPRSHKWLQGQRLQDLSTALVDCMGSVTD